MIAILDADKEGFLRSETSLIQTIGRCARNANGKVIMYADSITGSMEKAITETFRRRNIQEKFNNEHGIIPKTIVKEISEAISITSEVVDDEKIDIDKLSNLSSLEKKRIINKLEKEMKEAAKNLNFEEAMSLRDIIFELKGNL